MIETFIFQIFIPVLIGFVAGFLCSRNIESTKLSNYKQLNKMEKNTNTHENGNCANRVLAPVLIDWIVEYKEYWYDCNTEYEECTLNIKAATKEEAEKIGRNKLIEMDEKDNKHFDMVSRTFRLVCEEEDFTYDSSRKEPLLTGFQGYVDAVKFGGL